MAKEIPARPLPSSGWLRTLVFLLVYVAVISGFRFIKLDFLTRYSLFCFASAALVLCFTKFADKEHFQCLGLGPAEAGRYGSLGAAYAIALLGTGTLLLASLKQLSWLNIRFRGNEFVLSLGLMILVAFAEELVFRAYVLRNLKKSFSKPVALAVSAAIFAIFHLTNPGINWLPAVNIFLAGILMGIVYTYSGTIWFGISLHFTWNFLQGPVLGFPVSGLTLPSLLQQKAGSAPFLTGGDFGFEGSLLNTVLSLLAIASLWLIESKQKLPPVKEAVDKKL